MFFNESNTVYTASDGHLANLPIQARSFRILRLRCREDRRTLELHRSLHILRLTQSLLFGMLCTASIAWWVRSYWYADAGYISMTSGQHTAFSSGYGRMCVWFEHSGAPEWYNLYCRPLTEPHDLSSENRIPVFHLKAFWPKMTRLYVAHWFLAVATGFLALAPWIPRRISLGGMMVSVMAFAFLVAAVTWIDRTF